MVKKIINRNNRVFIIIGLIAISVIWILFNNRSTYEPQTYNIKTSLDIAIGGNVENSVERASFIVYGQYTKRIKEVK